MKKDVLIIFVLIFTITGCKSSHNFKFTDEKSVLDFYRQYSSFTDPGEYAYLYENLPDSLPELCQYGISTILH